MSASAFVPIDEEHRETARRDLSACFVVEAGAGTGKTTLMVDRILHIVRSGAASIEEVLAITFTEKAAAELRVRLRARLDAAARDAEGDERVRFRLSLDRFDQAQISTIHALAGTLLRERPVEARLDPEFQTLDDTGAELGFDEAWNEWLDDQLAGDPPAARRALNLGLELEHIRTAAKLLHDQRDLVPDIWPAPEQPKPPAALVAWLVERAHELEALIPCCITEDDGLRQIRRFVRWAGIVSGATPEAFERLLALAESVKAKGNQNNWKPKSACADQKSICREIDQHLQEAKAALGQAVTAEMAAWLAGFVRHYEHQRRERGQAEFQDLLIWARDLLRHSRPARAYFQRRFRYILVDEFQDTDPLQAEIVFFLAEDGTSADRWQDVCLRPGKLFIVGDPKQAIYRFRRADLGIYFEVQGLIVSGGGRELRIRQNFRSVEPVISWVNRVMGRLIGEGELPYQAAYQALEPSRPAHPGWTPPQVVALHLPDSATIDGARDRRRTEAGALARLIRRIVEEERWPVLVRDAAGNVSTREARYRDVALLFAATTEIELFEDALRAESVPYQVEGGRLFYGRQEVRDLTACLTAVDDPTNPVALVAALKSPAFAVRDDELFLFVDGGGRLDYQLDPGDAWPRLRDIFALLRSLHARRVTDPPAAVVEALLTATRLVELALLGPSGDQAAANLMKVVEQARGFASRPNASFRRFVQWLAQNQRRAPRESDSSVSEPEGDTVRLLTMHASKGLEFPIVLLANARTASQGEQCIVDRATGTIDFYLGSKGSTIFRTPGYEDAEQREKAHADAEGKRLFYVACTRAADHLVVPLFQPTKGYAAMAGDGVPPPGAVPFGAHHQGVHVYNTAALWHESPDPPPFRLRIGSGPEAEAALTARTEWETRRAALFARAAAKPADDGDGMHHGGTEDTEAGIVGETD
jgi:ATP-dependent helicase/nuclease subunit A